MFYAVCACLVSFLPLSIGVSFPLLLTTHFAPPLGSSCTPWGAILAAAVEMETPPQGETDENDLPPLADDKPRERSGPGEPSTATVKSRNESKSTARPPRRLPRYYSQLELTDAQRQQIEKLGEKYGARLKRLRDQIDELQQERDEQFFLLLSEDQQQKLKALQPPLE